MFVYISKKLLLIFLITSILCLLLINPIFAQENPGKVLSIAAGGIGGGFYMTASALSKVINDTIPNLFATVEVTGGGQANFALLLGKEVEIAMVNSCLTWELWNGKGFVEGDEPNRELRMLFFGFPTSLTFTSLKKYGISNFSDLEGKKISVYTRGSTTNVWTERILEALGIKYDPVYLGPTDSVIALKDGTISAFCLGWPNTVLQQLESEFEVAIIRPTEEELEKVLVAYPQYFKNTIVSDQVQSLSEPLDTWATYISIVTHKDAFDVDTGYAIVKAMYENEDIVRSINPNLADYMGIENTLEGSTPYLHPGLVKYIQEQEIDIPERLIPPEME